MIDDDLIAYYAASGRETRECNNAYTRVTAALAAGDIRFADAVNQLRAAYRYSHRKNKKGANHV